MDVDELGGLEFLGDCRADLIGRKNGCAHYLRIIRYGGAWCRGGLRWYPENLES